MRNALKGMGARAVGACREVQRQVRHFPPDFFPSRVRLDLTALGRTSVADRGLTALSCSPETSDERQVHTYLAHAPVTATLASRKVISTSCVVQKRNGHVNSMRAHRRLPISLKARAPLALALCSATIVSLCRAALPDNRISPSLFFHELLQYT